MPARKRPMPRGSGDPVLSQVLLLERPVKYDRYADLATKILAPALLKLRRSLPATQRSANPVDLSPPRA